MNREFTPSDDWLDRLLREPVDLPDNPDFTPDVMRRIERPERNSTVIVLIAGLAGLALSLLFLPSVSIIEEFIVAFDPTLISPWIALGAVAAVGTALWVLLEPA